MEDYRKLAYMYRVLRNAYEPKVDVDKSFLRKTAEIVQRNTHTLTLVGERAERIRKAFEEKQINSRQALKELERLVSEIKEARKQMEETHLSGKAFAVKWWMRVQKEMDPETSERLAVGIDEALREFPHWIKSSTQEGRLRKKIYKILLEAGIRDVVTWTKDIIRLLRRIRIMPMKRKWASVSTRGRLTLNSELLKQPARFRHEVIVHELVHLKLMDGKHTKFFKLLVRAYLSKYGVNTSP